MMAECRSVASLTVGDMKKWDPPNFQLCCQNRFCPLELLKKSVEKLEVYLCRLLAFLTGDRICPWAQLDWTLAWFRDKKIDGLSHPFTFIFSNTRLCPEQSMLFCLIWGTQCIPGLVCHGGCWQISCGKSHAWLISLSVSWKFSPSPNQLSSPPQGKHARISSEDSSTSLTFPRAVSKSSSRRT